MILSLSHALYVTADVGDHINDHRDLQYLEDKGLLICGKVYM